MGKLGQIGKISMRLYANDHLPPHLHATAPDFEALIEIETLTILAGGIPANARRSVMTWVSDHRAEIASEWNRINPRFPIT